MTDVERGRIRQNLISYARRPIVSPWYFVLRPLGVVALIIALITGGTVSLSYASNQALPTDKLYPIKLLTEEVVLASKKTPEEKAQYQVTRVAKRLDEAKTLAKQKKLTSTISHQIAEQVTAHVTETNASIKESAASNPNQALTQATALETTLEVKSAELVSTIETDQTGDNAATLSTQTNPTETARSFDTQGIRPDTRSELASVLLTVTATVTENKKELDKTKTIVVDSIKQTDIADQKNKAETALATVKKELGPRATTESPVTANVSSGTPTETTKAEPAAASAKMDTAVMMLAVPATSTTETTPPQEPSAAASLSTDQTSNAKPSEIDMLLKETQELFNRGEYAESLVKSEKIKSLIEVKGETSTNIQVDKK